MDQDNELRGVSPFELIEAILAGDLPKVQAAIASRANLDFAKAFGPRALSCAAGMGNGDILDALLRAGAQVDAASPASGKTACMASTERCEPPTLRALLQGEDGRTAVWAAARYGHVDCLAILWRAGADLEMPDAKSQTPAQAAVDAGKVDCVEFIRVAVEARDLSKAAVDPNRRDSKTRPFEAGSIGSHAWRFAPRCSKAWDNAPWSSTKIHPPSPATHRTPRTACWPRRSRSTCGSWARPWPPEPACRGATTPNATLWTWPRMAGMRSAWKP